MKRTVFIFSIIFTAAIVLSSCSLVPQQADPTSTPVPTVQENSSVISQGNLVPKDYSYLAFAGAGHVNEVLVKQGDQVTEGQILARLGDREQVEASIAAAQLQVENAQKALDDLNKNASTVSAANWQALLDANQNVNDAEAAWDAIDTDEYQQKVDDAEVKVSDAKTTLDDAQTEFDKVSNLDPKNPLYEDAETALEDAQLAYDDVVRARDELINNRDKVQANVELAKAQQAQAQSDYDATKDGPDAVQLNLAQMNLDTAKAQLTASQAALDNLDLKAPFAGTVVDVNISQGELVGDGKWAVLLADTSEWYVETSDLTEQEVVKISKGQNATLSPDALPDVQLKGKVTEIADMFNTQSGDVLYKVRILVENPDPALRWGMTVEVKFDS
jgi:multidrug efflux pump subunit AcrA (membrane-fusion protein)